MDADVGVDVECGFVCATGRIGLDWVGLGCTKLIPIGRAVGA